MPCLRPIKFCMCALLALAMSVQAQDNVIRIVADEWPPMTSSELHKGGFSVHLIVEVLTALGYESSVEFVPWKRIMRTRERGAYDIIPAIWHTPEREPFFAFTQPYLENKIVFASLQETAFVFSGLPSLENKKIGIVSSYSYPQSMLDYDKARWLAGIDTHQNVKKLLTKRLDMVIGADAVIRYEAQKNIGSSVPLYFDTAHPIETQPLHMAINRTLPKHEKLTKEIDRMIIEFKRDGRFQALETLHGLK
ncbi:MAG: polar amino acid transport system substrate-binding protein [Oceanicoccus sp.]|jgi:polar amino acid transport system substrate-binding protein